MVGWNQGLSLERDTSVGSEGGDWPEVIVSLLLFLQIATESRRFYYHSKAPISSLGILSSFNISACVGWMA